MINRASPALQTIALLSLLIATLACNAGSAPETVVDTAAEGVGATLEAEGISPQDILNMMLTAAVEGSGPVGTQGYFPTIAPNPEVDQFINGSCYKLEFENFQYCRGTIAIFGPTPDESEITEFASLVPNTPSEQRAATIFESHYWFVEGVEGQSLRLSILGSDTADPQATVYSPTGIVLADGINTTGSGEPEIITVNLPESGLYTIRVDFWDVGQYQIIAVPSQGLAATAIPTPADTCILTGMVNLIRCEGDLPVFSTGDLDQEEIAIVQLIDPIRTVRGPRGRIIEVHNWLFEGRAGQTVIFTVDPVGETDTQIRVFGPLGSVLLDPGDTAGPGESEGGILVLPIDGLYTLRVEFWNVGEYVARIEVQ
jgi:hypothetical protein